MDHNKLDICQNYNNYFNILQQTNTTREYECIVTCVPPAGYDTVVAVPPSATSRQTDHVHIRVVEVDAPRESHHRDVVLQRRGVLAITDVLYEKLNREK